MTAFDCSLVRRSSIALAASVALHLVVLLVVTSKPPVPGRAATPTILAWIERSAEQTVPEQERASSVLTPDEPAPDAPAVPSAEPQNVASGMPPASDIPQSAAAVKPPQEDARPAIEVPAPRDLTYYPIGALDRLPSLIGSAEACYPEGATGEVAYLLLIDDTGTVNEATLIDVKPVGLFTAAAVESCRGLKFTPAHKDGRAVRSRVRFVVGPSPQGTLPP